MLIKSIQGDGTTGNEYSMSAFEKERKDLIPTEITKDETKDSSDLQNIDLIDENEKMAVVQSTLKNDEDDDEFGDFEKFAKAVHIQFCLQNSNIKEHFDLY